MPTTSGGEADVPRPHHIHVVRDGLREVHALDEQLSQDRIARVWASVAAAMERGDAPKAHEAQRHAHDL